MLEQLAIHRIVIDSEHAASPGKLDFFFRFAFLSGSQGAQNGRGEMEFTAEPLFALHPNATSHEVHEPLANRQSQPSAAIATRRGHVGLRKRFENFPLLLLRD